MGNYFTIIEEKNNNRKKVEAILKLGYNNKEYLIYTFNNIDDNTKTILLSTLIKNENNIYTISDISDEDKNTLNSLVFNIIMILPSQKDKDGNQLINEFIKENSINLSLELPKLNDEKYFPNSLIAKVNADFIEKAIDFYHIYLDKNDNIELQEKDININTWTIPGTSNVNNNQSTAQIQINNIMDNNMSNAKPDQVLNDIDSGINQNNNSDNITVDLEKVDNINNNENISNDILPNPQTIKLAKMYEQDTQYTTNNNMQPNTMRKNISGNTSTMYIVIGTVCIVLALVVVAIAYIMIKNLK